jgi:hypothetical protein
MRRLSILLALAVCLYVAIETPFPTLGQQAAPSIAQTQQARWDQGEQVYCDRAALSMR